LLFVFKLSLSVSVLTSSSSVAVMLMVVVVVVVVVLVVPPALLKDEMVIGVVARRNLQKYKERIAVKLLSC
jgi:hypothetical protein